LPFIAWYLGISALWERLLSWISLLAGFYLCMPYAFQPEIYDTAFRLPEWRKSVPKPAEPRPEHFALKPAA